MDNYHKLKAQIRIAATSAVSFVLGGFLATSIVLTAEHPHSEWPIGIFFAGLITFGWIIALMVIMDEM